MSQMNSSRILLGGLIAGLIMNVSEAALHAAVLGDETGLLYERFAIEIPGTAANLTMLISATFILGIVSVWLYAALRPQFGAGPRTAVICGVAVWLLAHLWSGVYLGAGYAGICYSEARMGAGGVGTDRSTTSHFGRSSVL